MNKSIAVLGSINCDIVAKAVRLPKKGETVDGLGVDMFVGGKGANLAVQAAQLGAKTYMIGNTGNDEQGRQVRGGVSSKNVDITYVGISDKDKTGNCTIYVDLNGDNMLVLSPGANKTITTGMVDAGFAGAGDFSVLATNNEINIDAVEYGIRKAHELGAITIYNPAPAVPVSDEVLKLVDYITPNETESEEYTGILRDGMDFEQWKRRSAEWFLNKGVGHVCITLGDKGAYYCGPDAEFTMDAFKIKPVDTTAAGDSFNGGFAFGLANGWEIKKCVALGSACGAICAQNIGAQSSIMPYETVCDFLRERGIII